MTSRAEQSLSEFGGMAGDISRALNGFESRVSLEKSWVFFVSGRSGAKRPGPGSDIVQTFNESYLRHLLLALILFLILMPSPAMADLGLLATVGTGSDPYDVAVDDGSVYVTCSGSNHLMKFDATTLALLGGAVAWQGPYGVAVDGGSVYVACHGSNQLMKFDAATLVPQGSVGTGQVPLDVAVDGGSVYVTCVDDQLMKFDAATLALQGSVGTGPHPYDVAAAGGSVYAVCRDTNQLMKFDAATLAPQGSVGTGPSPYGVAVDGGSAYVTCSDSNQLMKFDAATLAPQGSVGTGPSPYGVAVDGGSVYVTCYGYGQLMKFDAATLAPQGSVGTGPVSLGVAVDGGSVYVTCLGSNQLMKFGEVYSVSGKVFNDVDGDGLQGQGEPGLGGVTVTLRDSSNNEVASTTSSSETDKLGTYTLIGIAPGTGYYLEFTSLPAGYLFTKKDQGGDDTKDSDVNPGTGKTDSFAVSGQDIANVDAGLCKPSISGTVYWDKNNNGAYDSGTDKAISVCTVHISPASSTGPSQITTDPTGTYSFTDLTPGTSYTVTVDSKDGYTLTEPAGGSYSVPSINSVVTGEDFGFHKTTLVVANNPSVLPAGITPDFDNIPDAVSAAISGDTIEVYGGGNDYAGFTVSGSKTDLTIKGAGSTQPVVNGKITVSLGCDRCTISGLKVSNSGDNGIDIFSSSNTITDNTITGTGGFCGIYINGITGNTITGNTITSTCGIFIYHGSNTITGNTITGGDFGIYISDGSGNTINGNTITSNVYGIFNNDGQNNYIYLNCVKGQGLSARPGNTWTTSSGTYSYNDRQFDSRPKGNYWSLYTGTDSDFDGIGNTAYSLAAESDPAPIMNTCVGWVFHDLNGNGVKDSGEPGLGGLTVSLSDGETTTTSSDSGTVGEYSFHNLAPGPYTVSMTAPADYTATTPLSKTDSIVGKADGTGSIVTNFGFQGLLSISGKVWSDVSCDGVQQSFEPGLGGWEVRLFQGGSVISTTQTSTVAGHEGEYSFDNLLPGTYVVAVTLPPNSDWWPTVPPYEDQYEGGYHEITLTTSSSGGNDFGNARQYTVYGNVFDDLDCDGVQDTGEPGLPGRIVHLTDARSGAEVSTFTTDFGGYYYFDQLGGEHDYILAEDLPSGRALFGFEISGMNEPDRIRYGSGVSCDHETFQPGDTAVMFFVMQDTAAVNMAEGTGTGSITITKSASPPQGSPEFSFVSTELGQPLILKDDPSNPALGTKTISDLQTGSYTIQETPTAGWAINGISVSDPGTSTIEYSNDGTSWHSGYQPASGSQAGDDRVRITLAAGDTPSVAFSNSEHGSIKLTKVETGGMGAVEFETTGFEAGSGLESPVTLCSDTQGTESKTASNLMPGRVYTICEPSSPCWSLTGITVAGAATSTIEGSADGGSSDPYHPGIQSGDRYVRITLEAGEDLEVSYANSNTATRITDQPESQLVCPSGRAQFDVSATGSGTLTYQWQKEGQGGQFVDVADEQGHISGATAATLVIDPVASEDAGSYHVVVTGGCGQAISSSADLTLKASTEITTQPSSEAVHAGEQASFEVAADGENLQYQWQKNGQAGFANVNDDPNHISGSTGSKLTIDPAKEDDAGDYQVVVTGACGQAVSDPVHLTVDPSADLSITKTGPASANAGEEIEYTLTVTNNGPSSVSDATLKDNYPDSLLDAKYSVNGGAFTSYASGSDITLPTMIKGQSVTVHIKGLAGQSVLDNTNLVDTASVTSSIFDPDTDNNQASLTTIIRRRSDVVISASGLPDPVIAGTKVTYTLTVTNNGPSNAAGAKAAFTLQSDLVFDPSGSTTGCTYDPATNTVTFSFSGDLTVNDPRVITIAALVPAFIPDGSVLKNTACVEHTEGEAPVRKCVDVTTTVKSLSLSGRVWKDTDGNSQEGDATTEPGLPGWTVELKEKSSGQTVATATTGQDGSYLFLGVVSGDYILTEVLQSGWLQTAPEEKSHAVTLTDSSIDSLGFGNRNLVDALVAVLTVDPPLTIPGSTVILTGTVTQTDGAVVDTVDVKITLPAGLSYVSADTAPNDIINNPDGSTTLVWNDLPFSTASTRVIVVANVAPTYQGTLQITMDAQGTSRTAFIESASASTTLKVLPAEVQIIKTAGTDTVVPGGTVSYNITYWNPGEIQLTDVVITDNYPAGMTFISASPSPDAGTDNRWTVGTLPSGASGRISVLLQAPESQNLTFIGQESAKGTGFVNIYRGTNTGQNAVSLTNVATLSCAEVGTISSSASVKVEDRGTSLKQTEHGSGHYSREELTEVLTGNKTIRMNSSLSARHAPTSFRLPRGQPISFSSMWSEADLARNERTGASLNERYMYASSIEKEGSILMDENGSLLATDAHFQGYGHLGALKKSSPDARPKASTVFEGRESYSGSFHLNETIEEYGSNVISNKSASGTGFVSSDKRVRSSQRTYEYGSGEYQSEEMIRTPESYIAKDITAVYLPAGSLKWKEGVWSRNRGESFLGEEISSADYLEKETIAGGLNDLQSNARYSGKGVFRAALKDQVDLAEEYTGQYQIKRKIHLTGVSRYDMPHLTLTKSGSMVPNTTIVRYTITVLNDGNRALGPVYVRDLFPSGTQYVSSSVKPTKLGSNLANWTFMYMSLGQSLNIDLDLNVTEQKDMLVNRVYATAHYDDQTVAASNFSVLEFSRLPCCQQELLATKTAEVDSSDPSIVWYRLKVKNRQNCTVVARVTDFLPSGLRFLDSSVRPESDPYNLSWILTDIATGETAIIDYRVQALRNGRFENNAHVDAFSVDGSGSASADVSTTVVVGGVALGRKAHESDWQPPDWQLDLSENICGADSEGSPTCVTCTSCVPEEVG